MHHSSRVVKFWGLGELQLTTLFLQLAHPCLSIRHVGVNNPKGAQMAKWRMWHPCSVLFVFLSLCQQSVLHGTVMSFWFCCSHGSSWPVHWLWLLVFWRSAGASFCTFLLVFSISSCLISKSYKIHSHQFKHTRLHLWRSLLSCLSVLSGSALLHALYSLCLSAADCAVVLLKMFIPKYD